MRTILTVIALTAIPAFCQDTDQKPAEKLLQKMKEMKVMTPGAHVFAFPLASSPQVCSIPLLNVIAPDKPVPMPNLKPPRVPNQMNVVVAAPACKPAPATKP